MGAFDIAEKHFKPVTQPSTTDTTSEAIPDDIEAWRICRAWKRILGVTLNPERVAQHLRRLDCHRPTPLADQVLAECENQSRVEVLAEIKSRAATRLKKEDKDNEKWPVVRRIKKLVDSQH
jgi:hypothetical protein